uniref:Galactosylgalactosylxylosylprotein 3-beta-glucuronosyltransferase n=1 Tax=Heterorhabditis bacteriophora TaxID=37862 RepID=A0A1I7X950_HETBA
MLIKRTSNCTSKERGWTHRNLALQYVRENYSIKHKAVLYFADDDNSYDLRLFDKYIRKIKRIGIWAVGLVGGALVEAPKVNSKGIISGWDVIFAPNRPFATDMAGFAINIKELFRVNASFNSNCAKIYKEGPESCFLSQFKIKKEQLEPFGYNDNPKEVLVWHTKTVKATAKGQKHGYAVE